MVRGSQEESGKEKQRASSPSNKKRMKDAKEKMSLIEGKTTQPPPSRFSRLRPDTSSMEINVILSENGSGELTTDADFCQQLLALGYVQSFVDFYHLTHRADPNAGESKISTKMVASVEDMLFIRDNLVSAELSRRQGNTSGVYAAYNKLAEFYVKTMDWRTSIFFHEKCLEVAQLTTDARAEMSANHSLGVVYQRMSEFDTARTFHERHEEIAKLYDVLEEVAKANIELYKVYSFLANRHDHEGRAEDALDMYQKCLESAKKCWDKAAEGEANGKIGTLLLNRGDSSLSIPYLREQSQIAADMGYAEGRCRACSALAIAFDSLGQADKALAELTMVHSISEQAGDTMLQSQACRALGTLYSKVGKLEEAVEALQRHFNLLKSILPKPEGVPGRLNTAEKIGSSSKIQKRIAAARSAAEERSVTVKDLDLARTYVGISKGNLFSGAYVVSLQMDLSALLDWKLSRTDLPNTRIIKERIEEDDLLSLNGGGKDAADDHTVDTTTVRAEDAGAGEPTDGN